MAAVCHLQGGTVVLRRGRQQPDRGEHTKSTLGPDSTHGTLDVRLTLKTTDDVIVYCEYKGRIDLAAGRVASAPLFQCGDEK